MIKHNKLEVFHFSKTTKNYNPPSLDLGPLEGFLLQPKDSWQYSYITESYLFVNTFIITLIKSY